MVILKEKGTFRSTKGHFIPQVPIFCLAGVGKKEANKIGKIPDLM
jgi:hypothetical protein